jgi:hypothetical protein
MQTRYPAALWRPLPENSTQPRIRPVIVILHTIVGSAAGAIRVMQGDQTPGESHFVAPFEGAMTQLMDCDRRADCNWKVNAWVTPIDLRLADGSVVRAGTTCGAISIETEDDGTPNDTPWSANQVEQMAQFLAWAHSEFRIPLERCPDPFLPGVGYHSMPGLNRLAAWDPHLTAGPYGSFVDSRGRKVNVWNPWTNTVGKGCPGPARIAQFDGIVARARALAAPPAPVPPPVQPAPATIPAEDDDMPEHIITNSEPLPPGIIPGDTVGQPVGQAKLLLLESGRLRHIRTLREWTIRGSKQGTPWTLAEIRDSGVVPGS